MDTKDENLTVQEELILKSGDRIFMGNPDEDESGTHFARHLGLSDRKLIAYAFNTWIKNKRFYPRSQREGEAPDYYINSRRKLLKVSELINSGGINHNKVEKIFEILWGNGLKSGNALDFVPQGAVSNPITDELISYLNINPKSPIAMPDKFIAWFENPSRDVSKDLLVRKILYYQTLNGIVSDDSAGNHSISSFANRNQFYIKDNSDELKPIAFMYRNLLRGLLPDYNPSSSTHPIAKEDIDSVFYLSRDLAMTYLSGFINNSLNVQYGYAIQGDLISAIDMLNFVFKLQPGFTNNSTGSMILFNSILIRIGYTPIPLYTYDFALYSGMDRNQFAAFMLNIITNVEGQEIKHPVPEMFQHIVDNNINSETSES